ncbi:MAG: acetoacetate--CoA ligase [Cyclonatronaceae bacterium]
MKPVPKSAHVPEGSLLWQPAPEQLRRANLTRYMQWLQKEQRIDDLLIDEEMLTPGALPDEALRTRFEQAYQTLWKWSVARPEAFWESLWIYFKIPARSSYSWVLADAAMPGARWFEGARLNFAEAVFRMESPAHPALIFQSETHKYQEISWRQLRGDVARLRRFLSAAGVQPGDRIAGYLPNSPHAVIGMFAAASLGAVWSTCSPDFGAESIIERFSQISPAVLITINGYSYGGKLRDCRPQASALVEQLPELRQIITIDYLPDQFPPPDFGRVKTTDWEAITRPKTSPAQTPPLSFEAVDFSHPLWILYSSGTTGLPKPLVHGHGGMLLEHLKYMEFHADVRPGDRFFWYSTTGWMMWNVVLSALLRGATAVLYDGNPAWPKPDALWEFAAAARLTTFGSSASFLTSCMKQGMKPAQNHDVSSLRSVGSTGSPLPPEGFKWVYDEVGRDILLNSTSGGTDICSSFVGGNPLLPVRAGEIQCRILGANVQAWSETGKVLTGEVGEMLIPAPMPCMPLFFWGDANMERYKASYFEEFPGAWRHGDWIKITERGSCVIYGRSDATLNKMGVRIGTAEIYRAVETDARVRDSLIVSLERPDGSWFMPLFVVLDDEAALDETLRQRIKNAVRQRIAPRFVPDEIIAVAELPYTLSGKKMERPVKRILEGTPAGKAVSRDAMRNPGALRIFQEFYENRLRHET